MPRAFTRAVSPRIAECALTHLERQPIDPARANEQHGAYERALEDTGFEIVRLPELPDDPDAVFVEDTAILLGSHAVITRPGAASRAGEADHAARDLAPYLTIHRLAAGTLDGGDVMRIGRMLYVGLSSRTNAQGADALRSVARPLGYDVITVEPAQCLHLKTAVTFAGPDASGAPRILVNPTWVDPALFAGAEPILTDEPAAANCLRAGDRLILPAGNPRAAAELRRLGYDLVELDVSELQKAEAGVTCMSLIES
ncbi:MAG TPA: N(G),N(G)-dimethylarginine dimethylaminohydrolase [Sphingomicrobium sp.]|jgi:dimethylargininase|nr:N(G),N(G)-dimethylarginine dimethylaminohydrolase [Sphingomicrobium sp.]